MLRALVIASLSLAFAHGATYRLDCGQSLASLRNRSYGPGDRILLKSGCVFKGQLAIAGSGAENAPIVIDRDGRGPMPRIEGDGEDAVLIRNQQWIEVRNLEVTNHGAQPALRRGVHIRLDDFGTARHIVVSGLYIHDVNGVNPRKDNGGIIWTTSGAKTPSRFDGLLLERNIVWKVDRSAMAARSAFVDRRRWFPSLHVVIRDNYVEDIGGDGIVPWASDGALVEHNIAKDCNKRSGTYNAGIWPWSCDNTTLRFNEAMWTRTVKDGQGFDSDYNSRNTLFEYNYSHDNEGGFLLICTPRHDDPAAMVTNLGVEVRHNISRNDKTRIFHIPGPVERIRIHDNAVYVGPGDTVNLVQFSDWKGWASDVEFRDNDFLVAGRARYGHEVKRYEDGSFDIGPGFGPAAKVSFAGNYFGGNHEGKPQDANERTRPKAAAPDWAGPRFDPSRPDGYAAFVSAHRAWLEKLMKSQFGAITSGR